MPIDDDGQVSRSSNAPLRDFEEDVGQSGLGLESPGDLLCQKFEERGCLAFSLRTEKLVHHDGRAAGSAHNHMER